MLRLALAQLEFPVGDIDRNLATALGCIEQARSAGAQIVLFPELALTGYPPEDLLLRPGFLRRSAEAMEALTAQVHGLDVLMGHPWNSQGQTYNCISWVRDGHVLGRYCKQHLPNYAVFDEQRYFSAGNEPLVIEVGGCRTGIVVCEDTWQSGPVMQAKEAGADLLLIANASPYRDDKQDEREEMLQDRFTESGLPMAYCNLVGGQDELVFDGRSMLYDQRGICAGPAGLCKTDLLFADFDSNHGQWQADQWPPSPSNTDAELYTVICRGLADYAINNGFTDVVLGLSGGIDSALTLALAADALGAEHVHAVMMPSKHTSELSLNLAREQADLLGVDYRVVDIEPPFRALLAGLESSFQGTEPDVTEENLQARVRGDIVMALSNKFGWLVLATGNKSELAVGYSTIYGDMCGGFSPIKDCLKTRVYALSRYRNTLGSAIPLAVIDRPPSAELAPGQLDQDSLPEYEVLDAVLHRFIDLDWSIHDIVGQGFEEVMVRRVARLVLLNEYKRRQGAPGPRLTARAFGRDRRYPITSGWQENMPGA